METKVDRRKDISRQVRHPLGGYGLSLAPEDILWRISIGEKLVATYKTDRHIYEDLLVRYNMSRLTSKEARAIALRFGSNSPYRGEIIKLMKWKVLYYLASIKPQEKSEEDSEQFRQAVILTFYDYVHHFVLNEPFCDACLKPDVMRVRYAFLQENRESIKTRAAHIQQEQGHPVLWPELLDTSIPPLLEQGVLQEFKGKIIFASTQTQVNEQEKNIDIEPGQLSEPVKEPVDLSYLQESNPFDITPDDLTRLLQDQKKKPELRREFTLSPSPVAPESNPVTVTPEPETSGKGSPSETWQEIATRTFAYIEDHVKQVTQKAMDAFMLKANSTFDDLVRIVAAQHEVREKHIEELEQENTELLTNLLAVEKTLLQEREQFKRERKDYQDFLRGYQNLQELAQILRETVQEETSQQSDNGHVIAQEIETLTEAVEV